LFGNAISLAHHISFYIA